MSICVWVVYVCVYQSEHASMEDRELWMSCSTDLFLTFSRKGSSLNLELAN